MLYSVSKKYNTFKYIILYTYMLILYYNQIYYIIINFFYIMLKLFTNVSINTIYNK